MGLAGRTARTEAGQGAEILLCILGVRRIEPSSGWGVLATLSPEKGELITGAGSESAALPGLLVNPSCLQIAFLQGGTTQGPPAPAQRRPQNPSSPPPASFPRMLSPGPRTPLHLSPPAGLCSEVPAAAMSAAFSI